MSWLFYLRIIAGGLVTIQLFSKCYWMIINNVDLFMDDDVRFYSTKIGLTNIDGERTMRAKENIPAGTVLIVEEAMFSTTHDVHMQPSKLSLLFKNDKNKMQWTAKLQKNIVTKTASNIVGGLIKKGIPMRISIMLCQYYTSQYQYGLYVLSSKIRHRYPTNVGQIIINTENGPISVIFATKDIQENGLLYKDIFSLYYNRGLSVKYLEAQIELKSKLNGLNDTNLHRFLNKWYQFQSKYLSRYNELSLITGLLDTGFLFELYGNGYHATVAELFRKNMNNIQWKKLFHKHYTNESRNVMLHHNRIVDIFRDYDIKLLTQRMGEEFAAYITRQSLDRGKVTIIESFADIDISWKEISQSVINDQYIIVFQIRLSRFTSDGIETELYTKWHTQINRFLNQITDIKQVELNALIELYDDESKKITSNSSMEDFAKMESLLQNIFAACFESATKNDKIKEKLISFFPKTPKVSEKLDFL